MKGFGQKGFTLVEVMIGLALLGLALTVLIRTAAGHVLDAEDARMMGIATDLARGKMDDIEERLMKEGFTDTDQSQLDWKPFEDEGWPDVYYSYKVEQTEMPNFDELQAMMMGKATKNGSGSAMGSGSALPQITDGTGSGSDIGSFQNSTLGGMLSMFGVGAGSGSATASGVTGAMGGMFIQQYYTMFQQILKVTIRKVTLTVKWKVLGQDRDMKVVAFYTDPASMDKVLMGQGAQDLQAGSGSGSSTGIGTGTGPATGSGSKLPGGR